MNIWFYMMLFVLLLVLSGMTIFFYKMIENIIEMILGEQKNKKVTLLLIIIALAIILFCTAIWNIGIVVLLYLMGFIYVFSLIDLVVKAIAKSHYKDFKIWRRLQKCYVLPIIATMLMISYGYWNMYHVVQTNYIVKTQKDIPKEGYRVALFADIHFGISLDLEGMKEVCEKVENQKPDMVILCGDIVDENTTYEDMEQLFQVLGAIKSRYGVYYVYGNHDMQKYSGQPTFTSEDIIRNLSENGITLLQDEKIQVTNDLVLVGRQDASNGYRMPLEELYKEVDKEDFIMTLDHQPLEYKINQKLGTDLLLSGHTHAGQLFPINLLIKMIPFGDAIYGETKSDSFTAIVTAGLAGWKFPIKTSASAEYAIIEIKN